jgi:hypothetical protein
MRIATALSELNAWRNRVAAAVDGVDLSAPGGTTACGTSSGWPRDDILQLLLALQPGHGEAVESWLVIGGDADDVAGENLSSELAGIRVVIAPFVLACGDAEHVRAWFEGARSVDLYPAERPSEHFSEFLDLIAQTTEAGQ